jgi:hypothetical protein
LTSWSDGPLGDRAGCPNETILEEGVDEATLALPDPSGSPGIIDPRRTPDRWVSAGGKRTQTYPGGGGPPGGVLQVSLRLRPKTPSLRLRPKTPSVVLLNLLPQKYGATYCILPDTRTGFWKFWAGSEGERKTKPAPTNLRTPLSPQQQKIKTNEL